MLKITKTYNKLYLCNGIDRINLINKIFYGVLLLELCNCKVIIGTSFLLNLMACTMDIHVVALVSGDYYWIKTMSLKTYYCNDSNLEIKVLRGSKI